MPTRRPSAAISALNAGNSSQPTSSLIFCERGRVVAGVVLELAPVLEDQPLVVGELVGLDEVDGTHVGAVLAELGRDRVHGPLHHVAALRAGPAPR